MRTFTATLATETNTFAPMPTGLSAFHQPGHYFKAGMHPPEPTALSRWMLAKVRERASSSLSRVVLPCSIACNTS